jgi:hypothetical protein
MKKAKFTLIFSGLLTCMFFVHGMKKEVNQDLVEKRVITTVYDLSDGLLKKVKGCYEPEHKLLKVRPPIYGTYQLPAITAGFKYKPQPFALNNERLEDFFEFIKALNEKSVPFALYCDGFRNLSKENLDKMLLCAKGGQMKELYLRGCGHFLKGIEVSVVSIPKSVTILKIGNNFNVDDKFVIDALKRLKDLKELDLWNTKVTDEAFEDVLSSCKNLKNLTLGLMCYEKLSNVWFKFLPTGITLHIIGNKYKVCEVLRDVDFEDMKKKGVTIKTDFYG